MKWVAATDLCNGLEGLQETISGFTDAARAQTRLWPPIDPIGAHIPYDTEFPNDDELGKFWTLLRLKY
jgi:hypothetical protein